MWNQWSNSARFSGRKRAALSMFVVATLVMVSAAAIVAASNGLLSGRTDGVGDSGQPRLSIVDVSHDPEEALVDETVEWTVVVEIADPSQRGKGLLFTWDWDDGTCTVNHLKSLNGQDSAVDVQLHSWAAPGTYEVAVSVWDGLENENSRLHNVSATATIVVVGEATERFVSYYWYDMFNHPIEEWYDYRAEIGNEEFRLTDEYPHLYLWAGAPPGNMWVHSFMRLSTHAANLTEVNMDESPEFLPFFSETERGGNAEIDWYINYITEEEGLEKLPPVAMAYFDGWFVALNGTITLDEQAAKAVLGIDVSGLEDFDSWWAANDDEVTSDWEDWMRYEAGPDRLDIFWMYEYPLQFVFFEIDAEKVGDNVVLTLDTISWGAEALMTRWLHEAFMPTEWYMEDVDFHASIGPQKATMSLDAAVAYSVYAYESAVDRTPCWAWEAMLQDNVLSGWPPYENKSLFDRYWDWENGGLLQYYNTAPGSDWYEDMMPYDRTPGAWNLSQGESMTFRWPDGPQMFFVHEPDYTGETLLPDTRQVYCDMSVSYAEPMPSDSDKVFIDEYSRTIRFEGPFDMWTWSKEQAAHTNLSSEWDRLGTLPRGVPYIEFGATDMVNTPPVADFEIDPTTGTVETTFVFDASSSWDLEDPAASLMARWDWESDGSWDTGLIPVGEDVTHEFAIADVYEITLQVMDTGGLTDEVSKVLMVTDPSSHLPHDPICIYGDEDFTSENGVMGGSGTPEDPYVIEGWEIFAPTSDGVHVEGAEASFVVRNVIVHSNSGENAGILIGLCTGNSVVENSVAEGFRNGIAAFCSDNLLITRCTSSGNSDGGIFIELCSGNVVISNNTVYGNGWAGGIFNNDSMDTVISGNQVYDNVGGISVAVLSENVTIRENFVSSNDVGMRIFYYEGSTIAMNDIHVYHNNFVANDQQTYVDSPEGVVSWDDGYPSGGNYWSDYVGDDAFSGPDQDLPYSDGIGDVPYSLQNGNEDRYPLMSRYPQPPNNAPVADFTVSQETGTIETTFQFDASSSSDVEDSVGDLMVRWDWESDGIWDTDWSFDKVALHLFATPGWHVVTLEVVDTWGSTDQTERSLLVSEELPGEPTLTYRLYDMFQEDWAPWWDVRMDSAWDRDRPLTTGEGSMTYLFDAFGDKSVGIIYTPYRWNVQGTLLPNLNVHEPMFMPTLGASPQTGAEATVHIYGQYLTQTLYDEQWVPYWETTPMWHPDYCDTVANNDDGWLFGTWINVTMNREAALEWLGMPLVADPATWWAANGPDYRDDYGTWVLAQGNEVYDIYCAYEYPYTDLYGMPPYGPVMVLEGDADEVILRMGDVTWGYEVLLTRWLAASGLSIHQSYMEDFEMTLEYSDAYADVSMDAVCQWTLKCVKQNASAVEWGAPCAWAWCPTHADYVEGFASHPYSAYNDYAPLTYQSWNCGDPMYENQTRYEYTPAQLTLPSYGRLIVELPLTDVPGYYAEWVPGSAVYNAFKSYNPSMTVYEDLMYTGEMELGYCDLSGAAASEWHAGNKTLIVQGPWAPTSEHPADPSLMLTGAPWLEFNVIPPSLRAPSDGDPPSEAAAGSTESVSACTTGVGEPICALSAFACIAAVAVLACAMLAMRKLR